MVDEARGKLSPIGPRRHPRSEFFHEGYSTWMDLTGLKSPTVLSSCLLFTHPPIPNCLYPGEVMSNGPTVPRVLSSCLASQPQEITPLESSTYHSSHNFRRLQAIGASEVHVNTRSISELKCLRLLFVPPSAFVILNPSGIRHKNFMPVTTLPPLPL